MAPTLERLARLSRRLPPSRTKVRAGRALTAGLNALGVDPVCTTTLRDGTRIVLDPRSRTEAGAFWNGAHEPDYLAVLKKVCDTYGGRLYDIGANVGLVALPLGNYVRGRGTVIAFEPVESNYQRLVTSIELNALGTTVRALNCALGASDGVVTIARESAHSASTGNAILVVDAAAAPRASSVSEVPMRRLDDVVTSEHLPVPDVVKLDVEGAEVGFLQGALGTLRDARPVVLGEFNSLFMPRFGTTFVDAAALVQPLSYRIFAFVAADAVTERTPEPGLGDVLLVPDEKVGQLPLRVL